MTDFYVQLKNGIIEYDILTPFSTVTGELAIKLERFIATSDGKASAYSTALLGGKLYNPFKPRVKSWKEIKVHAYDMNGTFVKVNNTITVVIDGDSFTISTLYGSPVMFADMPVKLYSNNTNLYNSRPSASIPNPSMDDIEPFSPTEVITLDMLADDSEVARSLRGLDDTNVDECPRDLAMDTYKFDTVDKNTLCGSGTCNGKESIIAFQGKVAVRECTHFPIYIQLNLI
jgi:hypothetical protein